MIQFMINLYIMMSSMIFMQMNHPLAMGFMLLVQTLLVALASGMISKTFWFSYILFLVFLGGMLVLFIYVTSLASNEMFTLSVKISTMIIIMSSVTLIIMMVMDMNMITSSFENYEMIQFTKMNFVENSSMLNKLYNFPTNILTLLLINYLLITMIAIVKITNVFYGPLRQMN